MVHSSKRHSAERFVTLEALLGRRRPEQAGPHRLRRRFRPRVEQLEDRLLPAVSLLQTFSEINSNAASQPFALTPPDTMLAVGPNTVIGAVNDSITLTNKTGGGRVGPTFFGTFFTSVFNPAHLFSDCQTMYDDQSGRFYVCILEYDPNTNIAELDFAASKGNSPGGLGSADWHFYQIAEVNEGATEFPDFPKMGWNNDAVFISTNQFSLSSGFFDHNHILAISKASILAGGALTLNSTNAPNNTLTPANILIPARMHNEGSGNLEYFVQADDNFESNPPVSSMITVWKETGYNSGGPDSLPGNPTNFTPTNLTVTAYNTSPGVAGLTAQIDDRMLSVDWIDNGTTQHMVASGSVGENANTLARWYLMNAPLNGTPTLIQQGDINMGPAIATSYPSVAINASDSIGMTFLVNGAGQATSMYVTGRVAGDAAGTMQTPVLAKAGVLPATIMERGGDYSATEFDPSAPANFWSANMFQLDNSGFNFHWGTQIAEYSLLPGPALTAPATQTANQGSAQMVSLGSFSDPNAGPWSGSVNWGDGSANTPLGSVSPGSLGGQSHTFANKGSYTVVVTVTNTNLTRSTSANFQVNVSKVGPSTISLMHNFADIGFIQALGGTPPDSMMAVGPTSVVGAVNTAIVLTDKSGNAFAGPTQFIKFFASVNNATNTQFSDPQVMYDDQANRFYACILEFPPDTSTVALDFAVSKNEFPGSLGSADWNFYQFTSVTETNNGFFADFPKMGWNNDAVFISTNQFSQVTGGFDHNLIFAITKESILAGGPLVTDQTDVNTGSDHHILIPARMHNESSSNLEYFVQSNGATGAPGVSTTVTVTKETDYFTNTPTFSPTPITVNAYNDSPGVAGLTDQIDDRMLSVDWVDNGTTQHMVSSGNVGENGINVARWYEFNAPISGTPTLIQQGDINPGGGTATSYPSIAINPSDSIAMTFLENGGGQPESTFNPQATSMYVTGRQANDPMGTMENEVLVKAGVLPATSPIRGGDYSATEYDPSDPNNFWSANEYQFDNSGDNFDWGNEITEFTFASGPGVTAAGNQTAAEGGSKTFTIGSFQDAGSGPDSGSINWGDGTTPTSLGTVTPGTLSNQTHTY
ncbi:MAG TPA: hypothetical protein VKU02_28950, partial [Gemmataceae bacterium]|nr:hypothetical protein [Gemmataceae bacterium]